MMGLVVSLARTCLDSRYDIPCWAANRWIALCFSSSGHSSKVDWWDPLQFMQLGGSDALGQGVPGGRSL